MDVPEKFRHTRRHCPRAVTRNDNLRLNSGSPDFDNDAMGANQHMQNEATAVADGSA